MTEVRSQGSPREIIPEPREEETGAGNGPEGASHVRSDSYGSGLLPALRARLRRIRVRLSRLLHPTDGVDGRLLLTFGDRHVLDVDTRSLAEEAWLQGGRIHLTHLPGEDGNLRSLDLQVNGKPMTLEFRLEKGGSGR